MNLTKQKTVKKISRGLASRYPLFYVRGWEEERIERLLAAVASSFYNEKGHLVVWTATKGFDRGDEARDATLADPVAALRHIANAPRPAMYLMKDLPALFDQNPALIRAIRDLYYRLINKRIFVFLSYPELILPEVLKKEIFLVEMDLPSEEEILDRLQAPGDDADVTPEQLHRMAGAMRGLSLNEVVHLQARLFRSGKLDTANALQEIQEEKSQLLSKESCLRFYPPQRSLEDVGGLDWQILSRR